MVMNSYIVFFVAICFLIFVSLRGTKKNYGTVSAEKFFSKEQTNWLRGIAIVGIAYSHYLVKLDIINPYYWQVGFLGIFGVAIFLFLSGYSAMISLVNKQDYLHKYIPKRLSRLYLPFIVSFIIYSVILLINGYKFSLFNIVDIFILSLPGVLNWYLKVQLGLYLLFYVSAKLIKNKNVLLGAMYLFCAIYMVIGYVLNLDNFWYESCWMFPLGMTFALNKDRVYNLINKKYFCKFVVSLIILIISYMPVFMYGGVLTEIIFVIGFIQFMIVFCVRFEGSSKIGLFLGIYSLEFYLSHTIVPSIIGLFYKGSENLITYIIFMIVSICLAFLIKKISNPINKIIMRKI